MNIYINKRLTSELLIYAAEMVAIIVGLMWVEEVRPDSIWLCFNVITQASVIYRRFTERDLIKYKGKKLGFCRVPAHIGIVGNEFADELSKNALKGNK